MQTESGKTENPITQHDQQALNQLMDVLELSDRTVTIFAIAPEISPNHPVLQCLHAQLATLEERFRIEPLFYYSDDTLYDYLQRLEASPSQGRRVVMALGLESLKLADAARFGREMKQLNLGREEIFQQNLILIFWLSQSSFLDEFRRQAPDFWDWRGRVAQFETRPPFDPIFYPYLEWLIAENSRLKIGGVRQVQRQVDIFLDQIYVSLQGSWVEELTQSELGGRAMNAYRSSSGQGLRSPSRETSTQGLEQLDGGEPEPEDFMLDVSRNDGFDGSPTRRIVNLDLAEAVQKHSHCVILGDPGAGKTTLLRYLARHHALAKRDNHPTVQGGAWGESLGEAKLPILFRIADYAEKLKQQQDRGADLSLEHYLRRFYRQWDHYFEGLLGDSVAEWLLEKMRQGECLVLLDGLDEVFDAVSRSQVVRQIEQFVGRYSNNRFVITSRIAGYQEASLGDRFQEFTIREMESDQIEKFLERWCLAVEATLRPEISPTLRERDAKQEAQGIVQAIAEQPGVKRFATNPLLLTILALIQRNGVRLPQRRVELYDLATKTLIEDWQFARNIAYNARKTQLMLAEEDVIALLAPLAFWMHEHKPSGLITQAEAEVALTPRMAELQGVDIETAQILVQQFLRKVREVTGLFVERAPASYGFMHLTFEEYFAARHIADNEIADILAIISPYRDQARWNEPILLALGYLSANANRVNRLMQQLFCDLDAYQPIVGREIRLKQPQSNQPILVWQTGSPPDLQLQESAAVFKDLLFAGQVLAEVKVNANFRKQLIEKLVITYLCLDTDFEEDSTQYLLKLLRRIELFNHDVLEPLQRAIANETLSEELHNRAWAAMLYIACGEAGEPLVDQVISIVHQLTPALFKEICNLVAKLGAEMTPALARSLADANLDLEHHKALEFMIGVSYLRADHYDRAIAQLQPLTEQVDCYFESYVQWAIAIAYEKKENYDQGLHYYQQCSEKLRSTTSDTELFFLWDWGICHRFHQQYEQSLEYLQQALAISKQLNHPKAEADIIHSIGKSYQAWGKYAAAIVHYEQSRDLYQQLERETNVADLWNWLSDCYREWGKYEPALSAEQQDLAIRQKLDDKSNIALAYWRLGRIYQVWGKYAAAIAHYEQSRDLYQQLEKETNVANQWYWLSDCYREWGKYKQALSAERQELAIRQKLDDKSNIASAYWRLGRIYQAWGKYAAAISHYEQSRNLYQKLEKETNVANQWSWLSDCYREWGKYEQALRAVQEDLAIRQKLDEKSDIANAYRQLGYIYQAWGKYAEAIAHYEQSRDRYQQLEQEKEVATRWYNLADCYKDWGKYPEALECQQKCLEIRQTVGDPLLIAVTYWQLGRIYQDWGKYAEAITHYEQSRDLYQPLEQEKDVAALWSWLSDCYREWGKYREALSAVQQELAIRQKLDEKSNIANAYRRLGYIYQAWGKYVEAIAHYEQSRDRYQQLEQEKEVATRWYNLADCYKDWGKYPEALECQEKCLEIRQTVDDPLLIAVTYWQLGRIYQDWGKYAEAIAQYEQSRDLFQQLGKEKEVSYRWYNLAECYREWGKYQQALECEQKDLELFQKLDLQTDIALSYYQFGRIYQAWGKYAEAIAYYEQSRDLYQPLEQEKDVANLWYWLSDCYKDWGKYPKALEYRQKCLEIRQTIDDPSLIAVTYYQLGRIYQAWGKYAEAIAQYEQSRDLYQQLGKEKEVSYRWYNLAECYREWGKYQQALECEQKDLELCQKLDLQTDIALSYYQFGRIYQAWGKYAEAIVHYEQSRDLYETLDLQQDVANQLSYLADCYRQAKDYTSAIDLYQNSLKKHQELGHNESAARRWRQLSNTQRLKAQDSESEQAVALLQQADQHLQQALQLDSAGNYRENLAYDQISLALLTAESLRWQLGDATALTTQFEQLYTAGFAYFTDLGKVVDRAEAALEIARAYLEIRSLENLDQAETLTRQSLQTFQTFNRHKQAAEAHHLLGEIYLVRADRQDSGLVTTACQFLTTSLHLYRELDLMQKASEIAQLMQSHPLQRLLPVDLGEDQSDDG
ncbi:MAG: tetratricopeptide repeat protein [Scytolyngbya sp. HA4215-MV1]|jgi:tetratricopeptide (TPR) repeat protein/GTPase SAR1 family protein|nr:tetratricopeptide repeat protein [Scytolyngbya sp. HA4215-MV1]